MEAEFVQIMDELRLNKHNNSLFEWEIVGLIKDDKMIVPKFGW